MVHDKQELARRAWEQAFNAGTREERIERSSRLAGYFNYLAKKQNPDFLPQGGLSLSFAELLQRECGLSEGKTILDVGTGTGGTAIEFARRGAIVTGIDMCSEALRIAVNRARLTGMKHIRFIEQMWEYYDTDERFDLCFSALCTGICSFEELLRFEKLSRKSCAIVTVGHSDKPSLRRRLREYLTPDSLPGLMAEGLYLFNFLYELGRAPNVHQFRVCSVTRLPVDAAIERYSLYYQCYGFNSEQAQNKIRRFIIENSKEGEWQETEDNTFMLIWWDAPESGGS